METTVYMENEAVGNLIHRLLSIAHQCTERYISPALLRHVYRGFCQWRRQCRLTEWWMSRENINRITAIERSLIHYLLERCYWIRYGDSDTVTDLLKELFLVDGHLGKIFDFQQLSLTPRKRKSDPETSVYSLVTTWTDEIMSNEEMQPIYYFMEHANKRRALFNGRRLAEHYFVQCISHHREVNDLLMLPPCSRTFRFPEILVRLLQYGLFAKSDERDEDIGKLLTGIIGVILNLNENCKRPQYTSRIIEVGNVLLRAVPRVRMSSLLKEQKLRNKEHIMWYLVRQLSVPDYLPYLRLRCTGPQELQHSCRRTVRRILYNNWKLPQGIFVLPLPELLKEYINLQCD